LPLLFQNEARPLSGYIFDEATRTQLIQGGEGCIVFSRYCFHVPSIAAGGFRWNSPALFVVRVWASGYNRSEAGRRPPAESGTSFTAPGTAFPP
jgi:hypothetical protein